METYFIVSLSDGKNCTLLQISVCVSACAICKCVQCALASPTVPKGRSGWAKTNFFLYQTSINALILFIRFFTLPFKLFLYDSVSQPCIQRFVYVECGIKSDELSKPHRANSLIHNFKFSVNRQRRIGGVATKNCGLINR